MSTPSPTNDSVHRLVLKLAVAVAAVAVTAAVAFNERPVERPHAPLSKTAATSQSDMPEAATPTAAALEMGARP